MNHDSEACGNEGPIQDGNNDNRSMKKKTSAIALPFFF